MKAQKTSKHVTPKWVDRLLIGILLLIPILYAAGFNVNYGPSMSHLGWFYRTSWGEQPTCVGQIVRFAKPNQPAWRKYILPMVKRVADIRPDGLFVEGDNENESEDSRDWGKTVPPDHVAGVVNWCWSPMRVARCWNAEGSFVNWLSLNLPPSCYKVSHRFAAAYFPSQDATVIYLDEKEVRSFPSWKIRSDWKDGQIMLGQKSLVWHYMTYRPTTDGITSNLDIEGCPLKPDNATFRTDKMRAEGGIVNALDNDPDTKWIVDSTRPQDNHSSVVFDKPFTGTISFEGTIVSGAVLCFSVNGGVVIGPLAPWNAQKIQVKNANTVNLVVSKLDEQEAMIWKITSVKFQP